MPPPGDPLAHHAAGYAKVMCTAVFMTGLAQLLLLRMSAISQASASLGMTEVPIEAGLPQRAFQEVPADILAQTARLFLDLRDTLL